MQEPQHIAIIGAGQMGTGFATHFHLNGQRVSVIDHRESNLDDARNRIRETISFLNNHDQESVDPEEVVDEIEFTLDTERVADVDIVLETVTEDLDIKREVFEEIGELASEDAILATNTSSIPITDIAEGFSFADRIIGCHWLYPPYLMTPVEVIRGAETADETVETLTAFIEQVNRRPIVVNKDVPGFVWNRVQYAVLRECLHIVEEGVASIEDVNAAIRDGYARRTSVIGPFETVDIAGLDLFHTIADDLYPALADNDTPSELFDEYVEEDRYGIDVGEGFFEYDVPPEQVVEDRDQRLLTLARVFEDRDPS